ncbi:Bax inhibitor-1/YccA family protein [Arenivirga flava]|uniref:Bax inhibitor-1/YccA family protein n=1 Tax=Arenivirga flava TaxID=1930060 RepID=A0AA37XBB6_9MICO|nr:Bax inhibitor-1/YccA family protein [Arenivirga flava]GMA28155.1 hypothetical protein GCM10025874_14080 [Arenivirga flava]
MALTNPAFTAPEFSPRGNVAGARAGVPTPPPGYQQDLSAQQLGDLYDRPAANSYETDRMSYEDTIKKAFIGFGVLVLGAVAGWAITPVVGPLIFAFALVGFVLALVNTFKKQPSGGLVLAYAAAQGVFVGGISLLYSYVGGGVVPVAVIGTLAVVGITLALFMSGKVRSSPRATKIFLIALLGYAAFSLVNFVLVTFGVIDGFGLFANPLFNLLLMGLVVVLAAYSLVLDFEAVKHGVENGAPRSFGWRAVFGIMVTVVWLYLELLRFVAIFSSSD